jgi:hypothetical protein
MAILLLALAAPTGAGTGDLLDLLQPGSHPDVGLGGDPLPGPFADTWGFWSDIAFTPRWSSRLDAGLSIPIGFGPGKTSGRVETNSLRWTTATGTTIGTRGLLGAVRIAGPTWKGTWRGSPGPFCIGGTGNQVIAGARLADLLPGLTLQGIAPIAYPGGETAATSGVGMRYRLGQRLQTQASMSHMRVPERFESGFYDEPISASVNLQTDRYALDGSVRPLRRLAIDYSTAWSFHGEIAPLGIRPIDEITPHGRSTSQQVTADWNVLGARRLLLRWTESNLDVSGVASRGGLDFGKLTYLRSHLTSWLGGVEIPVHSRTRVVLDAEQVDFQAGAHGVAKGWPFVSGLGKLLGSRMTGVATGSARWTRWHAAAERRMGINLQTGVTWYDIQPRATLTTWLPGLMGFGKWDIHEYELNARRVQLGALSLGLDGSRYGWRVALQARQFVFARVFRDQGPATIAVPGQGQAASRVREWPGGTQVEFTLARNY